LEFKPNKEAREGLKSMFKDIQSYEILDMLKVDYEEGMCVDLIEFILKDGISIDDVKSVGHMEIMSVLKSEGPKHTCLIKYYEPEEGRELFKEFDLDLISTTPNNVSEEKVICSYIGENENLLKLIELVKIHAGTVENMTFKKAIYQKQDILTVLTDKQREIMITAHKSGYYEYPKKINSEQLSKKVNISKPTLVQHLRKAEGRIFNEILEGHSLKKQQ